MTGTVKGPATQPRISARRKPMLLALMVPWIALALTAASLQMHGLWLRALVAVSALAMTTLLVYVVMQMVKLKRGKR